MTDQAVKTGLQTKELLCPNCQSLNVAFSAEAGKFVCKDCQHPFTAVIESFAFLVDVQNLYCSVRDSYGVAARVDFRKLRERALKGRKFRHIVSRAYFSSRPEDARGYIHKFIHALRKLSYDVKEADLGPRDTTEPHVDVDSQLMIDATNITINGQPPSVVVVASGDSQLLPVYAALKAKGCRVEVLAFTPSMSSQIVEMVNEVTELDRDFLFADTPEHVGVEKQV